MSEDQQKKSEQENNSSQEASNQQQDFSQKLIGSLNAATSKFSNVSEQYSGNYQGLLSMYNQKYDQGKQICCLYWTKAYQQLVHAKIQAQYTVLPYYKLIQTEKNKLKNELKTQYIRQDNQDLRKNIINFGTFAVTFLSVALLKKGYLRYGLRNGVVFYFGASYIICPEKLNPF
ncbi:UNKNOWN [Stylonychia lemnae]|uniref:Transmembrane protein n=1 Tax=Stylonychia lemnae TaxID=5949 RepID=A0A078B4K7_STYLE|nr:UNKNOWN [Stylonychia lemnae]|eukprot:CDW89206.1 UNKNOWN [Stylonychia lemnae]